MNISVQLYKDHQPIGNALKTMENATLAAQTVYCSLSKGDRYVNQYNGRATTFTVVRKIFIDHSDPNKFPKELIIEVIETYPKETNS